MMFPNGEHRSFNKIVNYRFLACRRGCGLPHNNWSLDLQEFVLTTISLQVGNGNKKIVGQFTYNCFHISAMCIITVSWCNFI